MGKGHSLLLVAMPAAPFLHYTLCHHPAIFSTLEPAAEGQPRIREPVHRAQLEAPGGLFSPLHILTGRQPDQSILINRTGPCG